VGSIPASRATLRKKASLALAFLCPESPLAF